METKEEIDKKGDKIRRLAIAIYDMNLGESISPTNLANIVKIHPDTLRDILDTYDNLKTVGFETVRDKTGKIKTIVRTDNDLNVRTELREIKKELIQINENLDFMNTKKSIKKDGTEKRITKRT